ncbi:aspartyl-trna synthetase [Donghicola sp. C2-DW-16]|uniref:Aspartyl-trna synthetase n=1 Tax=Donghicola mangrovi TaxID=2729614 RepID=A0A850QIG7_9RHOB|nr:SH3 domain-containing protein [Donghicola mangrovi]NVO25591.1 aspartyl-trna synthetase [Donghicola mangrovi]NVO26704.1 aspartyl-trna synthetase [Donghicola mangrovi]
MSFRATFGLSAALLTLSLAASPIAAQEAIPDSGETLGPVTNLPLPRFVSMKSSKAFVRRGPSQTHRVDWEFKRRDLPVEVTAEYGHWRRIRDRDGAGGWIHYALLSGRRTALVDQEMISLFSDPDLRSTEIARLQKGVIAQIVECIPTWCELKVDDYRGWTPKTGIWGVKPDEVFD